MKEYLYTKMLGIFVGALTILAAVGFGILFLIGTGLSNALNSGYDNSSSSSSAAIIIIILLLFALITGITPFKLKNKIWRIIYIGFCFILGIGFVIAFIISIGALGLINELFILCLGIIYLGLSYLAYRRK
ncbi:hypothetical protein KHA93_00220 [Bacillus sp. FJAT-49732]|uniref:Uncharacterized protein n=1 Tax=Lederbergia citrisecunda TaxID=2833583 RepID=A0A942TKS3_9BACI|nr:hypothetical protein [Lederbergia citrisecunda]MBS4198084.1 hypothetical protein [Lederbergia citrisecunda]